MSELWVIRLWAGRTGQNHWSLFVPYAQGSRNQSDWTEGKLLDAMGDAFRGFYLRIDRRYNYREERNTKLEPLFVCKLPEGYVVPYVDSEGNAGLPSMSTNEDGQDLQLDPGDRLEALASTVPLPTKSLRSAQSDETPRTRIKINNCQNWIQWVVQELARQGLATQATLNSVQSFIPDAAVP